MEKLEHGYSKEKEKLLLQNKKEMNQYDDHKIK